uniref:uncharacterized protein LOC120327820 n=1 Tax=Styela clava TaxID=7725 RepID=UPI001939D96D|nr:uncharacterized protein LOC120327820 [Styela clava]
MNKGAKLIAIPGLFDISVIVQFGGASDSSSCGNKDSFTASNNEELRAKLAQKLESVLLGNKDDFVTISSHFRYNNELHSTDLTKLDVTTDDVTDLLPTSHPSTAATSDESTSSSSNTNNVAEYTFATDDDVTGSLATDNIMKTSEASKYFKTTSASHLTFESTTPKKFQTTGMITSIVTEHTTPEVDKISSTDIERFTTHTTGISLLPENCDVIFDQKCFRVIVYPTQNITLPIAKSICSNMGRNLANVYNEDHYRMLMSYMRAKIYPEISYFSVWTGMTFENDRIHLTSGEPSTLPTSVWYPNLPVNFKGINYIGIDVNRNPNALNQGLFNALPNNEYHGALCELKIE